MARLPERVSSRQRWALVAVGFLANAPLALQAQRSVTLAWDPNTSPDVIDYVIYYGTNAGVHPAAQRSGGMTTLTIPGLTEGRRYFFAATAVNRAGLESKPTPDLPYDVPITSPSNTIALLVVTTRGDGGVTPNLSGQSLIIGQPYTLTAVPGAGQVFAGWTGGVTSSSPVLTFVMRLGLALEAVFAVDHSTNIHSTNIVQGLAMASGNYTGLFGDEAPFRQDRAGSFTVTTTQRRTCSGKLQLGGRRYSFSGPLGAGGLATSTVARSGTNVVGVELIFGDNGDPDEVNGRLTAGAWQTLLRGHQAGFHARTNPAPCAGRYTLVIPGQDSPVLGPEGNGVAAVKVDSYGRATFAGTLADGTKVSHKAALSKHGQWPLYVPLYSGGGSVLSWLTVTNAATNGIQGRFHWIKPAMPKSKQYVGGFTNLAQVAGSPYVRPASSTNRVLNLAQAEVVFDGGNLAATLTNTVALGPRNKIINLSGSKLSLAISSSVGLFSGRVVDPFTRQSMKFNGALLQDQNCGFGFLLGTNRSSRVWFGL